MAANGVGTRDIASMAVHLPRESTTMLAVHPLEEIELWDADTHLLATAVDLLSGANWQRTGKRIGKPKPVPRPKVKAPPSDQTGHESIDDFRAWYAAQPGGRQLNPTTE